MTLFGRASVDQPPLWRSALGLGSEAVPASTPQHAPAPLSANAPPREVRARKGGPAGPLRCAGAPVENRDRTLHCFTWASWTSFASLDEARRDGRSVPTGWLRGPTAPFATAVARTPPEWRGDFAGPDLARRCTSRAVGRSRDGICQVGSVGRCRAGRKGVARDALTPVSGVRSGLRTPAPATTSVRRLSSPTTALGDHSDLTLFLSHTTFSHPASQ